MVPTLQTERLFLRPLELSDAEQAQPLFAQWEIVRYLTNIVPWPYPSDGTFRYYRDMALPQMERGEAWHWTLRVKTNANQLIGSISLMKSETNNRAFWLGLPWQRRGLMTEACEVVTDFWFETLKFDVLRAPKAVDNIASRQISQRQGMRVVATQEQDYVSGRLLSEVWEITAEERRQRHR